MFNSQCSILIRTEGGRTIGRTTGNPTSTSAENCALGIEHWSDPRSDAEQWILSSYFCASPKPVREGEYRGSLSLEVASQSSWKGDFQSENPLDLAHYFDIHSCHFVSGARLRYTAGRTACAGGPDGTRAAPPERQAGFERALAAALCSRHDQEREQSGRNVGAPVHTRGRGGMEEIRCVPW